jgi:hypothetical protein
MIGDASVHDTCWLVNPLSLHSHTSPSSWIHMQIYRGCKRARYMLVREPPMIGDASVHDTCWLVNLLSSLGMWHIRILHLPDSGRICTHLNIYLLPVSYHVLIYMRRTVSYASSYYIVVYLK